ncbi:LysE/ArgO family amino acid transporter [Chelativorans sp. M5D2P16]|uniref:LysE/ArgO family amino acid transporter n=1 Tax=Chelativorans sp. M5D2P16 TaxID=3095678 RepID=UPI002ACAE29C|nr:LysE/ArgO family amino acid transporter [Chelativorans sp. M5D2P16]MDZ5695697.1 LysE/ArgO family amino acid transporter [Chelativorans sp. M5D2P16]
MAVSVYMTGLTIGLGLIVAIGAQNAFVLRQGLRNEHVFAVCLACSASDALLITLGVTGFQRVAAFLPWLDPAMRYGGAAFLLWFGARSLYSAMQTSEALEAGAMGASSLHRTLATCLALTWLNPHVYVDTVVLLGTVSTQFPDAGVSFAAGAVTASFLFFFTLGYGATRLRPVFARPSSWRVLEALIAVTMWAIAWKLLAGI